MFVLQIDKGQTIRIGPDITIFNLGHAPGSAARVKIGVQAPREIPVHRSELLNRPQVVPADK